MQLDSDMCTVAFISCIRRDRSYDGPLLDPVKCLVSKASWLPGSPARGLPVFAREIFVACVMCE